MSFKDRARLHQYNFFSENEKQNSPSLSRTRAQTHWLNESSAKEGILFYNDYDIFESAKSKRKKNDIPEWFLDTLRSQHIPFNFFIPLRTEKDLAVKVFNYLYNLKIDTVLDIFIEYPPNYENPLNDRTSFDSYLSYTSQDEKGFIGFEIKFTEGGYTTTSKEYNMVNDESSVYYEKTKESGLYNNEYLVRLKENNYRQIWRNHLLAYVWYKEKGFKYFLSSTLYPEGNTHFTKALRDYNSFLTLKGVSSLKGTTYEIFFDTLEKYAESVRQKNWINYLKERYLVK